MPRNIYDEDHEAMRASAREFVTRTLAPRAEQMIAEKSIPREFWLEAGKQGFLGLDIPEEFGGAGVDDYRFNAVVAEEMSRFNAATARASASTPTSARPTSSTSAPRSRSSAGSRHRER